MASIPLYCRRCGAVTSGSGGIHISNASLITVVGGGMQCPKCGGMANFAEGTFSERGKGLELDDGPPLTKEILRALQSIAERVAAKEITTEEAIQQIKKVDPELGNIIGSFGNILGVVAILLTVIQMYLQYLDNRSTEQFRNDVLEHLQRQTIAMEQIGRVGQNIAQGPTAKTNAALQNFDDVTIKKTGRRTKVNHARKEALLEYRKTFKPRQK